jgi:hypothetical protein
VSCAFCPVKIFLNFCSIKIAWRNLANLNDAATTRIFYDNNGCKFPNAPKQSTDTASTAMVPDLAN